MNLQINNKNVGLTFGKYIPLHAGHESIIRQMYADGCTEIIVCVYDCPSYGIDTTTRANWIRDIFKGFNVNVLEFKDSPQEVGYSEDIMKKHEDYFEREMVRLGVNPYKIDSFYSSEPYGEHMSKRFGWKKVFIDIDRKDIQISATEIRNDLKRKCKFLHPIVQKDMPKIVTLLGGESTGKSTLGQFLADRNSSYFGYIPEYGAEYWEKHNKDGKLDEWDLIRIMVTHKQKTDDTVALADKVVYMEDTNNLVTWRFGVEYGVWENGDMRDEEDLYGIVSDNLYETDLYVLCDTDIPFDPTGGRISDEIRHKFNTFYKKILDKYDLPYIVVSGTVEGRAEQIINQLNKMN